MYNFKKLVHLSLAIFISYRKLNGKNTSPGLWLHKANKCLKLRRKQSGGGISLREQHTLAALMKYKLKPLPAWLVPVCFLPGELSTGERWCHLELPARKYDRPQVKPTFKTCHATTGPWQPGKTGFKLLFNWEQFYLQKQVMKIT